MKFWSLFSKGAATPSDEAIRAHSKAVEISLRADAIHTERRKILDENHFAERIRLIYEGR